MTPITAGMQLKHAILDVQLPETKASHSDSMVLYMCRRRAASYKELQQRHERHQNLSEMAGSTVLQRAIMVSCCKSIVTGAVTHRHILMAQSTPLQTKMQLVHCIC